MGIAEVSVTEAGRGYFNIDPTNEPSAIVDESAVISPEENATLEVRLGGFLSDIIPRQDVGTDHMDGGSKFGTEPVGNRYR